MIINTSILQNYSQISKLYTIRKLKTHKEIYRIIDEAEFVDSASYRNHYETTAARIVQRLHKGTIRGEIRADAGEVHAWALMGMNVFLGLRFGVWSDDIEPAEVARIANDMIANGLKPPSDND